MMDEYITRNNAISAVCFGCNQQFSDEPCEPSECSIRQSIMALPTADVVPKSEVERLDKLFKDMTKEAKGYLNRIYGIRADVAREIFEEIETCMKDFEDDDDGYLLKKCEFEFFMREIRDKYTEN